MKAALISILFAGTLFATPKVSLIRLPMHGKQPQVVTDAKGVGHIVFLSGKERSTDVFYMTRSNGKFSKPMKVNAIAGSAVAMGTIRGPHIALGKYGRVHIAWNGSQAGGGAPHHGSPMFYTRMHIGGSGFEKERNLMTWTTALDGGGSVAADGKGNVYVVWHAAPKNSPKGENVRGVFVATSTDGGKTWEKILHVDDKTGCVEVKMHPTNPDTLIVAMYERQRDGFDTNDPAKRWGPGSGIYKTTNGGAKWTKLKEGLPTRSLGRVGISYYKKNPDIVYAIIETDKIGDGPAVAFMGISGGNRVKEALIQNVTKDGPSDKAGIKAGDIILQVAEKKVENYNDLIVAIRARKPNEKVKLKLKRGDEEKEVELTFAKRGGSRDWLCEVLGVPELPDLLAVRAWRLQFLLRHSPCPLQRAAARVGWQRDVGVARVARILADGVGLGAEDGLMRMMNPFCSLAGAVSELKDRFEVLIAVDGQEGVNMARSESPNLILMDMSLPVMDGWEAVRNLKDDPETKSIPVLGLSAHAMTPDRDKAINAGCDDYDTKPVDIKRLLGKIQALLDQNHAG